jgi:hypothetical protein
MLTKKLTNVMFHFPIIIMHYEKITWIKFSLQVHQQVKRYT